jgi:UDP-N-acetylmuramate--alanine ligase
MLKTKSNILVHFVGIGGIGMSGIAEVLLSLGYKVSGSDVSDSPNIEKLKKLGAQVFIGHNGSNCLDATVMVYSSAINESNPEIRYAKKNNIPLMRRAEMLAELMRLKHGLAVAGTHGKTTTTSFLATILQESDFDPTYIIGGVVKNLDGHAKVGEGKYLVAEADESDGSFLLLNPIMSIITNIDNDHLDHYGSEEKLEEAFLEFANSVPFYGHCFLNYDDPKIKKLITKMRKPFVTFGMSEDETSEPPNYWAQNVSHSELSSSFELYLDGEKVCQMTVPLPGDHNILNALGAIAMTHQMGLDLKLIQRSIKKFDGVGRRFQKLFDNKKMKVVDDYGHHPTEIRETVKTALSVAQGQDVIVVFEPHRYTRTRDCWKDFLHCFNGIKKLYVAPIYAASEKSLPGISTQGLVADINRLHPNLSVEISDMHELGGILKKYAKKDCYVLTMGAGSIGRVVRDVVAEIS